MTKIIGICLIKNEDLFIEYAIRNCIDFCDKILILDNKSIDNTFNIITNLKSEYSKISIISVNNCKDTNKYINKYAGTDTWIFGVDGDEIYDKSGLSNIRKLILDGKFNNYYAGLSKLMLLITGFVYVYFCVQSFIFVRRQKKLQSN